jgi:hypothetical protein
MISCRAADAIEPAEKSFAAEMAARYGAETTVLDWRERLASLAAAAGRLIWW